MIEKVTTSQKFRNFTFFCTPQQIEDDECEPYVIIRLKASPYTTVYHRKYPKIVESIGEMGGFLQVLILILEIIYFLYNSYFKKMFLSNNIILCDDSIKKLLNSRNLSIDVDVLKYEILREVQDVDSLIKYVKM